MIKFSMKQSKIHFDKILKEQYNLSYLHKFNKKKYII